MSNVATIPTISELVFRPDGGLNIGRVVWGIGQKAKAWGFDPRDNLEHTNSKTLRKELRDRNLEYKMSFFRDPGKMYDSLDVVGWTDADSAFYSSIADVVSKVSKETFEDRTLAILADACSPQTNKDLLSKMVKHFDEATKLFGQNGKKLTSKEIQILAAEVIREVVVELKTGGTKSVTWEAIAPKLVAKAQAKVDELFKKPDALNTDKTQWLLNCLKAEFAYDFVAFLLEVAFIAVSPALAYSLTRTWGLVSVFVGLYMSLALTPHVTGLMEGVWQEFSMYGSKDGPKSFNEAKANVWKHMQENWKKAVDSDQSLHPFVNALVDKILLMSAWYPLANWFKVKSFAFYYGALDTLLAGKSSGIKGEDQIGKRMLITLVTGVVRGLVKDWQRYLYETRGVGEDGEYRARVDVSYHAFMITFFCAAFGYVMKAFLEQYFINQPQPEVVDKGKKKKVA